MNKSKHQMRVEEFMIRAGQDVPTRPTEPSQEVRLLRAKLILEEALETIYRGLGVSVLINECDLYLSNEGEAVDFMCVNGFDMKETIDGCCDIKVVTTGTLSACGVPDKEIQKMVDNNNLEKFGPGHSIREDGKLIKPPYHKAPDIQGFLERITG